MIINWLGYPFFILKKHEKDAIFVFFLKNMLENFLGFGRMHENKIFFFVFEKGN